MLTITAFITITCLILHVKTRAAHAATPSTALAQHDRDVIRFFRNHPRLANTSAGEQQLWRILAHVVDRQLQTARRAVATTRIAASAAASSYSASSMGSTQQGCAGAPPLRDAALSVATFLVGCGQRVRICYGRVCVIATRWDSGPYVAGRQLDLNVGVTHALIGSWDPDAWGVRTVTWSPA